MLWEVSEGGGVTSPMVGLGWLQVYLSELHPLPILRFPREGRQSLLSERLL